MTIPTSGKEFLVPGDGAEAELESLRARVAELEVLAFRDGLTRLFNRRHFDIAVQRWIARVQRYGGDHVLLFIDINNLKSVNDSHGHVVGDRLLTAVADVLAAHVRMADVAARIGGDEFGLLLEHITEAGTAIKIEDLSRLLSDVTVHSANGLVRCSCAIGQARIQPDDTAETLLDRADRDMYCAKA